MSQSMKNPKPTTIPYCVAASVIEAINASEYRKRNANIDWKIASTVKGKTKSPN
jgi:hypothetical protein